MDQLKHLGVLGRKQPKVDISASLLRFRGANKKLEGLRRDQLMNLGLLGKTQPSSISLFNVLPLIQSSPEDSSYYSYMYENS